MPVPSPRALDRAVEGRWPRLFRYEMPTGPLYLALVFQATALALVLVGPPSSYAAGGCIGGTIGLLVGFIARANRSASNRV